MPFDDRSHAEQDHQDRFVEPDWETPAQQTDEKDPNAPFCINFQIVDPVIIEALSAVPEGLARVRYAEQALRIGILAIQSANGKIDSEAIRNEGNRLIGELSSLIEGNRTRTSEEVEGILRNYFNPENGRFTENVERLVRKDGDLQRLLQGHMELTQTRLQQTIGQLVGQESPIMRMLSPGDANVFFTHLSDVANTAIQKQNQSILQQFSLDVPESALNRLLTELRTNHTAVGSNLQTHITEVMQEFSLDHEDSALNRMLKQIQEASSQIRGEFTLDNEESALARVRRELKQLIQEQTLSAQAFQERISNEISALVARRQEAQRGVQHGNDFEAAVVSSLQELFYGSGDEVDAVGQTTGEIPRCRVGDAVITLGPDCIAADARIVIEAKQDDSYGLARVVQESGTARENRKADYCVFVISSKMPLAEKIGLLRRYEKDILVVWDAEDRSTDVALKAAVLMAKGLIVRSARERQGFVADLNGMDSAIAGIIRQLEGFDEVSTAANTVRTSGERILNRTRLMRERIEKELEVLSNEIQGLRNSEA
jgi:hypothetical protein